MTKDSSSIKTNYTKLSGLKTVGDKIDLGKFEKPKPTTQKPNLRQKEKEFEFLKIQ